MTSEAKEGGGGESDAGATCCGAENDVVGEAAVSQLAAGADDVVGEGLVFQLEAADAEEAPNKGAVRSPHDMAGGGEGTDFS